MVNKPAFSLFELLFAIIIIAISVTTLPMINQVIQKGISANIVQEAIFAAATELKEATSAHWDENSFEKGETETLSRIIDIPINPIRCDNNSSSQTYRQLPGHINQALHRRCLDSNITSFSNAGVPGITSLWDKTHTSHNIFKDNVTNAQGYKQRYNSKVTLIHPAYFNGRSHNIKEIIIKISTSDGTMVTSLSSFCMNIGEVDYFKKEY